MSFSDVHYSVNFKSITQLGKTHQISPILDIDISKNFSTNQFRFKDDINYQVEDLYSICIILDLCNTHAPPQ